MTGRCVVCGGETPPPRGRKPRKTCDRPECAREVRRRGWRAGAGANPAEKVNQRLADLEGTTVECPRCNRRLVLCERNFSPSKRSADGSVRIYDRWCRRCRKRRAKANYRRRMKDPVQRERFLRRLAVAQKARRDADLEAARAVEREREARYRREKPEMERARQERYRARVKEDAEKLVRKREQDRMDHRLRLEKKTGLVVTEQLPRSEAIEAEGEPRVDPGPFIRWWDELARVEPKTVDGGRPIDLLAESLGTTDRTIRRVKEDHENTEGESRMELDVIDRAFVRAQVDIVDALGRSPADPDYAGGGVPFPTAGAWLLRRYYPDLYVFAKGERSRAVRKAEGDALRNAILRLLREEPRPAAELAALLGVSPQVASYHVKALDGRVTAVGTTLVGKTRRPVYAAV